MPTPTKDEIAAHIRERFTDYCKKRTGGVVPATSIGQASEILRAFEDGFEAGVMYCADMVIKSRDEADAARKED